MRKIIILVIISLIFSSCEKIIMKPNPDATNKAIFNEYAKLVKEKFAMLKLNYYQLQAGRFVSA